MHRIGRCDEETDFTEGSALLAYIICRQRRQLSASYIKIATLCCAVGFGILMKLMTIVVSALMLQTAQRCLVLNLEQAVFDVTYVLIAPWLK